VGSVLNDVRCVVFDVGETLVDETRLWTSVADHCGVPVATLCGVLGGLIESGEHHGQLWEVLGVDRYMPPFVIESSDLYPDAADCIESARRHHPRVGIAGNQPEGFDEQLSAAGVRADFTGSSAQWGVRKPDPEFFARVADAAGVPAAAILYVGDRLDNDVLPAHRAGMRTAHLRRGTWGYLHARHPERAVADIRVDSLTELTTYWASGA
jgi:HAD superfamily hydrolase (TIGR01509 family)